MKAQIEATRRDHEWLAYYNKFPYFSPQTVRDGCQPRIMEHAGSAERAIVLVHGLTDSPYYMTAIAEYFFYELGYNVYLPLLHGHGLKEPNGMEGVKLEEWKANVKFAIQVAAERATEVSIGGLSTGGTLSFYLAVNDPIINGGLYLFSAAFDLAGGPFGLKGELRERLLRTFMADLFDDNSESLIGPNPYRYTRTDVDGARELARLIQETDRIFAHHRPEQPFSHRSFAAHSESDTTVTIQGVEAMATFVCPHHFTLFRIPKAYHVSHASVVLKEPVYALNAAVDDEPLEKANPLFHEMIDAIGAFQRDVGA